VWWVQDGTMSVAAREKALMDFEEQEEVAVMLMSLKAASVGLNLVCANHVLLLDVWWNPTVEDQAIDRAHRLGQRKPVQVRYVSCVVHAPRHTVCSTSRISSRWTSILRWAQKGSNTKGETERNSLLVEILILL
jgi:hypothetical protein